MIETSDLQPVLEAALRERFGSARSIASLERRASPYRTSFALEELHARLDDGATLDLIFKDVGRHAMLEGAQRAKPPFVINPLREIETYRRLLAPLGMGTATLYGAVADDRRQQYWLFLEKVPGVELYQVGDIGSWQAAARWLAALHEHFAGEDLASLAEQAHLLRYDADYYRTWLDRAHRFFRDATRGLEWISARYDKVVDRLMALPVTFIHGEFYASNVLVQETTGDLRICPVDWEMAAVGPGLIDLATLTAGDWTDANRAAIAAAYFDSLGPRPRRLWPTLDDFLPLLDCCRIHINVQWLGWFGRRRPPAGQARDWLREAVDIAERLGL